LPAMLLLRWSRPATACRAAPGNRLGDLPVRMDYAGASRTVRVWRPTAPPSALRRRTDYAENAPPAMPRDPTGALRRSGTPSEQESRCLRHLAGSCIRTSTPMTLTRVEVSRTGRAYENPVGTPSVRADLRTGIVTVTKASMSCGYRPQLRRLRVRSETSFKTRSSAASPFRWARRAGAMGQDVRVRRSTSPPGKNPTPPPCRAADGVKLQSPSSRRALRFTVMARRREPAPVEYVRALRRGAGSACGEPTPFGQMVRRFLRLATEIDASPPTRRSVAGAVPGEHTRLE